MRVTPDPVRLEVFKHLFAAIAEEMGIVLQKASFSPNIKERRDFSCALFNARGDMIAQAAHIPVHLGSMPLSVAAALQKFRAESSGINPGDVIILNDPYRGGTHLPDITMVTPIFTNGNDLVALAASRAHHADVGGIASGSMSIAQEIFQEGIIIPPVKLIKSGDLEHGVMDVVLANVRTPEERSGDLWAQIAANRRGATRFRELVARYGFTEVQHYMDELLAYTERMTRGLIKDLPDGTYGFTDYLDDDGVSDRRIPITVAVTIDGDHARVDFTGSAPQQRGSVNAVHAITLSAVYYVFRCLVQMDIPNNSGCLAPIEVIAPTGTVVNATNPAAVAGGNVETSQRIVDVLLGALAQAVPERVPAASQGSMNNVTIGGKAASGQPFAYYETIGGGVGARPWADGPSGVHSHMTNTLNTPVEALEYAYPLQVMRYEIRRDSGGGGKFTGGDGIRRDIQLLVDAQISLISERRRYPPYGLKGGEPGATGENYLFTDGKRQVLPGKGSFYGKAGDVLSIRTPGGGGYGRVES